MAFGLHKSNLKYSPSVGSRSPWRCGVENTVSSKGHSPARPQPGLRCWLHKRCLPKLRLCSAPQGQLDRQSLETRPGQAQKIGTDMTEDLETRAEGGECSSVSFRGGGLCSLAHPHTRPWRLGVLVVRPSGAPPCPPKPARSLEPHQLHSAEVICASHQDGSCLRGSRWQESPSPPPWS